MCVIPTTIGTCKIIGNAWPKPKQVCCLLSNGSVSARATFTPGIIAIACPIPSTCPLCQLQALDLISIHVSFEPPTSVSPCFYPCTPESAKVSDALGLKDRPLMTVVHCTDGSTVLTPGVMPAGVCYSGNYLRPALPLRGANEHESKAATSLPPWVPAQYLRVCYTERVPQAVRLWLRSQLGHLQALAA
jgi:hypothetical protein